MPRTVRLKDALEELGEGPVLTYDLHSLPHGWSMTDIYRTFTDTGMLIYDSEHGKKPQVIIQGKEPVKIMPIKFGLPDNEEEIEDEIEETEDGYPIHHIRTTLVPGLHSIEGCGRIQIEGTRGTEQSTGIPPTNG